MRSELGRARDVQANKHTQGRDVNLERGLSVASAAALGDLGLPQSEVQDVQVALLNKMIARYPLFAVIVRRLATSFLNKTTIDACKIISSCKQDMRHGYVFNQNGSTTQTT